MKPVAEGMSVERRYYRLLPGGERKPLGPGDILAQGEEVFVELTLDAHEGEPWRSIRSAYYVVEDAVPAGFTPLGEDKAYRGAPYDAAARPRGAEAPLALSRARPLLLRGARLVEPDARARWAT